MTIIEKIWKALHKNKVWSSDAEWAFCPMYSPEIRTKAGRKLRKMMLKYVDKLVDCPTYQHSQQKYVFLGCVYNQEQREKLMAFELDPDSPLSTAMQWMKEDGYEMFAGRWDVPGQPLVIAFDIPKARKDVLELIEGVVDFDNVPVGDVRLVMSDVGIFEYLVARFVKYFQEANNDSDGGNFIIHRVKNYSFRSVIEILKDSLYI